jgi:hypothetical protein
VGTPWDQYQSKITSVTAGRAKASHQQRGSFSATTSDSAASSPSIPSWATTVWIGCKNTDFVFAAGEAVDATHGIDIFAGQIIWPIDPTSGDTKLHMATVGGSDTIKYTFLGDT